jgi:ADP-ribose pyrophosphatase YjhB (NUDIX family)
MREKRFCPFCATPLIEKFVDDRNRRFCPSCDAPLYENPVPASCLIVTGFRDQLLLVKRSVAPKKGYWCLPGGFMELGETPQDCALRELKEETGLLGRIAGIVGVWSNPSKEYGSVALICFHVREYAGALAPGDDAAAVDWFEPVTLPEIAFDSHQRFIRLYYEGQSEA